MNIFKKKYTVYFLAYIFLSTVSPVDALTIEIDISDLSKGDSRSFHLNGIKKGFLSAGDIIGINNIERVIVKVNEEIYSLPEIMGQRLLQLLSSHWSHHIKFFDKNKTEIENPYCTAVNLFLKFGFTSFTGEKFDYVGFQTEAANIPYVVNDFSIGDMFIISNIDNDDDNNSYIYLGGNLFIGWECEFGVFYIYHVNDIIRANKKRRAIIQWVKSAKYSSLL